MTSRPHRVLYGIHVQSGPAIVHDPVAVVIESIAGLRARGDRYAGVADDSPDALGLTRGAAWAGTARGGDRDIVLVAGAVAVLVHPVARGVVRGGRPERAAVLDGPVHARG